MYEIIQLSGYLSRRRSFAILIVAAEKFALIGKDDRALLVSTSFFMSSEIAYFFFSIRSRRPALAAEG